MPDNAKLKRKEKPKRPRYKPSLPFVALGAVLIIIFLLVFGWGVTLEVGIISRGPSEFDMLSTQIAATNQDVAIQIEQTNAAIMQPTSRP